MTYSVYILVSIASGRYYIGQTKDLDRRLHEHNHGKSRATQHGAPWKLIHTEMFETRSDAYRREQYLKSLKKRVVLERIIYSGVEQSGSPDPAERDRGSSMTQGVIGTRRAHNPEFRQRRKSSMRFAHRESPVQIRPPQPSPFEHLTFNT